MRILVSGATGNVGRLVVEQALARGHTALLDIAEREDLNRQHVYVAN